MALHHLLHLSTILATASTTHAATCDPSTLNTTVYRYPITIPGTTIADVANATNRGICDIGRYNCMADVDIVPNVGQQIIIPPQVCAPDSTSCLIDTAATNTTNTCVAGGPRLYYTVNGDTYAKIAARLNITVASLLPNTTTTTTNSTTASINATTPLPAGQFVKAPLCDPSQCVLQPYSFTYGTYKDLAARYGTTVGQIMMLSVTYNYSEWRDTEGQSPPTIDLPVNCTVLAGNYTVLT